MRARIQQNYTDDGQPKEIFLVTLYPGDGRRGVEVWAPRGFSGGVNWSACGAQPVAVAREYAEAISLAASIFEYLTAYPHAEEREIVLRFDLQLIT